MSDGKTLAPNWKAYILEIATDRTFLGELEMAAACAVLDLQICVLRPNLDSILIGSGKRIVWLKFEKQHFARGLCYWL